MKGYRTLIGTLTFLLTLGCAPSKYQRDFSHLSVTNNHILNVWQNHPGKYYGQATRENLNKLELYQVSADSSKGIFSVNEIAIRGFGDPKIKLVWVDGNGNGKRDLTENPHRVPSENFIRFSKYKISTNYFFIIRRSILLCFL